MKKNFFVSWLESDFFWGWFIGLVIVLGIFFLFINKTVVADDLLFVNDSIDSFTGEFVFRNSVNINFSDDFKEQLINNWNSYEGVEYSACINGRKVLVVEEGADRYSEVVFVFDKMFNVNVGKSNFVNISCPVTRDVVGVIHSHPNVGCRDHLSSGDVVSAKAFWRGGIIFFLIQCSEDKVEVYGRDNMWEGKIIKFEKG